MITAALLTIAKSWKQPKRSSTDEWINKMWSIYIIDYCAQSLVMSDSVRPHGHGPPGSSAHGPFQARILEGLPFPTPGDLPSPRIEPRSPASTGRFFLTEPLESPEGNVTQP